jgi:hypothetical protein
MVKRVKRAKKGIESLKKQIEEHFGKIERDIQEKNIDRGKYHLKEIDKGLLKALEIKIKILGTQDDNSVQIYRERLEELRKSLELNESE